MMTDKVNPFDPTISLRANVARKRKLAEVLMQLGLKNSDNYRSPMQVVGQLAQALVGRNLDKQATQGEEELLQTQRERIAQQMLRLQDPNVSMNEKQQILAYNPDIPEAFSKPTMKQLEQNAVPDWTTQGGVAMDRNSWKPGQVLPQDPNAVNVRLPDGSIGTNPAALQARQMIGMAQAGLMPQQGVTLPNYQDPNMVPPPPGNPGNNGAPFGPSKEEAQFIQQNSSDPELMNVIRQKYPDWFAQFYGGR